MIEFKFLPVNVRCLLESDSRDHFCTDENCCLKDNVPHTGRNLQNIVRERVLAP